VSRFATDMGSRPRLPEKPTTPQRAAEAAAPAPFIYFDIVPNFGFNVGVANLTLEAVRFMTPTPGIVTGERVAVAHIRTSIDGLRQLKAAIEGIEAIIQRPAPTEKN
jgi:hypothetical protein